MNATIEWNEREFSKAIEDWSLEVGYSAQTALKVRARSLIKRCMNLTPPRMKSAEAAPSGDGGASQARTQMKKKIDAALNRVFFVAPTQYVEHVAKTFGQGPMDVWETLKNKSKINLRVNRILFNRDEMRAFHYKQTQGKGDRFQYKKTWQVFKGTKTKSERWQAQAMVAKDDYKQHLEYIYSHVGRMRAAWAKCLVDPRLSTPGQTEYTIPQWVSRHINGGSRGAIDASKLTGPNPEVTITNWSRGVRMIKNTIHFAMKVEAAAMKADMQYYIKGIKERHGWT